MNTLPVLKNNIKVFRRNLGLTQLQLAVKCRVSKNTISSLETGNSWCSAIHAALLCRALHCKFEELFYLDFE